MSSSWSCVNKVHQVQENCVKVWCVKRHSHHRNQTRNTTAQTAAVVEVNVLRLLSFALLPKDRFRCTRCRAGLTGPFCLEVDGVKWDGPVTSDRGDSLNFAVDCGWSTHRERRFRSGCGWAGPRRRAPAPRSSASRRRPPPASPVQPDKHPTSVIGDVRGH